MLITICYHYEPVKEIAIPYSILIFNYTEKIQQFYIVSICADRTIMDKSKGSGSLLLDDLITVSKINDIDSILLNSVLSSVETYRKKGFICTGNDDCGLPEMKKLTKRKSKNGSERKKSKESIESIEMVLKLSEPTNGGFRKSKTKRKTKSKTKCKTKRKTKSKSKKI